MPQGTIKNFDPTARTASVLDDQLTEHAVDAEAFAASGLQELRIGQRVRFEFDGDRVTQLNIITL